ncbi:MAG: DMT family transporter [Candidatus Dojkabacteria bacterium]
MGILFALIYATVVSIGKIILKKSFAEFKPSVSFFWETVFGILIWLPLGFLLGGTAEEALRVLPIALLGAILSEAYIFYIYTKGDISIIGTVFPTYSIFTIFFSALLLNESLSNLEIIAVLLTLFGIFTIVVETSLSKLLKSAMPVLWALSGAFAVGIGDTLAKGGINETSAYSFLIALGIAQIPVALAFLTLEKSDMKSTFGALSYLKKYKFPLIAAFLIALAQFFFWLAFEGTKASIASPLTSTNTAFTALFAYFILKEKLGLRKTLGVCLVIIGILVTSLASN